MVQTPDQGQEFGIVNKALTKVPRPHLTGMVLGKDIKLGDLQLNAIDDNDVVWVCTDIGGWWNLPDVEVLDLDKGWGDGSFQSKGRYRTRILELEGVILPPDASKVQSARDTLVRAINLVRNTTWLIVNEADYTKAVKVRLSGKPKIENVNARGRIEFSIGLVAVDPVKYEWFGDSTTTDYAETQPRNATGSQSGYVTINNKGNYPVGAVYEIEGPIVSGGATIFNETTGDLMTIVDTTRGKMYRYANAKTMTNGTATITVTAKHNLVAGDEVELSLPQNFGITNFVVSSGVVTFTANATHNFAIGDVFAVSNVHANVNSVELTVASTPAHNTFTASTTSGNITTTAVTGTVENITNKKLNGTFIVDSVVNNYAFTYVTSYNDSVTNVAQTYANSSPTVFRDADILEIDTTNREVAFNGDATQKRGMLDPIIDWVQLDDGNNVVQFDDSNVETNWVYRYSVVANTTTGTDTITLYTTNAHGFTTSDSVTISNVSSNVNTDLTKSISTYASNANTVTLVVSSHGYANGNYVVVSGISKDIDGLRSVTNVNANAISFTTTNSGTFYTTNAPDGATTRKVSKVDSYSRSGNTVTVIANAHGFYSNDAVFFTGLSNVVDGLYIVTNVNANAMTYTTRTSIDSLPTVNTSVLTNNVVTLTTANSHGLVIGDYVYVSNLGSPYNGTFQITNVSTSSPYTLSYSVTNANITSNNLVTGYVQKSYLTSNGYSAVRYQVTDEDTYKIVVTKRPNTATVAETAIGAIVSTDNVGEIGITSVSSNVDTDLITVTTNGEHGFSAGEHLQIVSEGSSSDAMDDYAVTTGHRVRVKDWQRYANGVVQMNTVSILNSAEFNANNYVTIDNLDASVDGTYQITTKTNATNYSITTSNTTAVSLSTVDNAYMKRLHKVIYYTRNNANASSVAIGAVASYTQSGTTLVVTTNADHTISIGNTVVLYNVKDELDYRPLTVSNINAVAKTFEVTAPYSATDSNSASIGGFFNTSKDNYLSNTSGNVVYVAFDSSHGIGNNQSLAIYGLSSSVDGVQKAIYVNASIIAYVVDGSSLREPKRTTSITRSSGSTTATVVTTTNHGFNVGDSIYVQGAGTVGDIDGQWTVYANISANSFSYVSGGTTAHSSTTGDYIYPSPVDVYVEEVFPIISKTNTTFTYWHPAVTNTATNTLTETPGEVVKNSDGTMRVYFKSGWIG